MYFLFKKLHRKQAGMTHSIFTQGHPEYSRGMTYVELIVVLSIFAIVTGTVIFNYQNFQAKVEIKNLANDIALKVVEAQKNSTSGKLPYLPPADGWKPSYGIYFNPDSSPPNTGSQIFYYFVDLDQNKTYDQLYNSCPNANECIEKFLLTNNNFLSTIEIHYYTDPPEVVDSGISLTYTRPDSTMTLKKSADSDPLGNVDYVLVRVESEEGPHSDIYIYSSGRIEIR